MQASILLPGDPGFYETLENLNLFDWHSFANQKGSATFVVRAETGLLDCVDDDELSEYIYGGEYGERLALTESFDSI